jgi:protein TonB
MSVAVAKSNAEFKKKYRKYVRNATWVAALIHVILFAVFPAVSFKPYRLKEEKFELVDLPPDFEVPAAPTQIAMPQINVRPAEENEPAPDSLHLPETTFDDFSSMPPPPPREADAGGNFLAFDEAPVLIEKVTPEYPLFAREAGLEGTVRVRVLVDEDGNVRDAQVVSSDSEVWPSMERAAVEAAMKCRFRPALQRTTPVKAHVVIPFEFLLN